jgi:hypothetical protein
MRFFEFKPQKPLTPEKARIRALKLAKDNATKALRSEREMQKLAKIKKELT